jgi:hypothetical protein
MAAVTLELSGTIAASTNGTAMDLWVVRCTMIGTIQFIP